MGSNSLSKLKISVGFSFFFGVCGRDIDSSLEIPLSSGKSAWIPCSIFTKSNFFLFLIDKTGLLPWSSSLSEKTRAPAVYLR